MRKCVSRHSSGPRASPCHSSAMPTPPVNPVDSSTIITLRCVRWFSVPSRRRAIGRNQRTCTPARPSPRSAPSPSGVRPTRPAARAPARPNARVPTGGSRTRRPISPFQYTNVSKSIVCVGTSDGVEHRGKDLVAVAQDVDAVALGGRDSDDAFERPTQVVDAVAHVDVLAAADEVAARWQVRQPCAGPWAAVGRRAPLRVARRPQHRRARRPTRGTPTAGARRCRRAVRTSLRRTYSPGRTSPTPSVTAHQSSTEIVAPNASHDHCG